MILFAHARTNQFFGCDTFAELNCDWDNAKAYPSLTTHKGTTRQIPSTTNPRLTWVLVIHNWA